MKTISFNQLKNIIKEDALGSKKEKEKGILDRAEEEYRNGNPGGALRLMDDYLKNNEPFYKYDFERWRKRCLAEFGAVP